MTTSDGALREIMNCCIDREEHACLFLKPRPYRRPNDGVYVSVFSPDSNPGAGDRIICKRSVAGQIALDIDKSDPIARAALAFLQISNGLVQMI